MDFNNLQVLFGFAIQVCCFFSLYDFKDIGILSWLIFCLSTSFGTIQLLFVQIQPFPLRLHLHGTPGWHVLLLLQGKAFLNVEARILRTDRWKIREHSWINRNAGKIEDCQLGSVAFILKLLCWMHPPLSRSIPYRYVYWKVHLIVFLYKFYYKKGRRRSISFICIITDV